MMKKYQLMCLLLIIVCSVCGCGSKKEKPSSDSVSGDMNNQLQIINSSDCEKSMLEEILADFSEIIEERKVQQKGKTYSCISVCNNEDMDNWPNDEEKVEVLSEKYMIDYQQDEDYVLVVDKDDKRLESIKDNFLSILIVYDEKDTITDTMVYKGAAFGRVKTVNDSIVWEVQEIEDIQCDYANQDKEIVCRQRGVLSNKTYNVTIGKDGLVEAVEQISEEKDVYWEGRTEENKKLSCIFAENRTLSIKEIIADEDVKNYVKNEKAFPMSMERYGCAYRETYNGIGGEVYVTSDDYVVVSTSLYLGYYKMTQEELDKIFEISDDKSGRGRYGFFETEKEMELLFVDGEVNPKLLEELK